MQTSNPNRCIVVLNAGSSSIKFSVFRGENSTTLKDMLHGSIEKLNSTPHFSAKDHKGSALAEHHWPAPTTHEDLLDYLINWIESHLGEETLSAAGHRVAHGGLHYITPQKIDPMLLKQLRGLTYLAPLHQPHNLAPIEALTSRHPKLPQIACFDTAFHASNSKVSREYGLPQHFEKEGICRFGFHGLSYEYIASELPHVNEKAATGRTIVAHLGNGASMCGLVNGKSVASTMGFSALDGLVMGTRCGTLDPGVLLYLMQEKNMTAQAIEDLLYRQSGLLGVSGISNDVRTLIQSNAPKAKQAIELFTYRAAREIGSLTAATAGLDALVFTAGIGENADLIRSKICKLSAWLGIEIDTELNQTHCSKISTAKSAVSVWVIPTNEELMIARHTFEQLFTEEGKP